MKTQESTYRNVLKEVGYSDQDIQEKIKQCVHTMFYGSEEERIYHPFGEDMGYIEDTGNNDARTEGMSYGMMFCVQLNMKEEFNRIWKWAKTYMYMTEGMNQGYFAWSCKTDGTKNYTGPAPDGEEYFAMALFFAAHRWGNGEGIFDYEQQAKQILHDCIHRTVGDPMWNLENYLIKFVPNCEFSDPSYHLPHFYDLFALYANEEDKEFWTRAAQASREYLQVSCDWNTGLCPEYAEYDGKPYTRKRQASGRRDWFYSDAYRTIANIGLDYEWCDQSPWHMKLANQLQCFFAKLSPEERDGVYLINGERLEQKAMHPVAMIATRAQASLAADNEYTKDMVKEFFEMPLRTGKRRYYDNCLYLFALLSLSGNYRIW